VVTVRSEAFALFQSASIQPAVDFSQLEIVLIITNFQPVDISPLIRNKQFPEVNKMRNIIGIILFGILAILQSTIVSRMLLLQGTADLILLFIVAWLYRTALKHPGNGV